jgi:signal transduction histidine kinase
MIHANQGRIWIEDAKSDEGTRVIFTLPVCASSQQETEYSI